MIKFEEILEATFEWMAVVLFKPFNPKKWLILGFAAFLAGYLSGGCRLNLPLEPDKDTKANKASFFKSISSDFSGKTGFSNQAIKESISRFLHQPYFSWIIVPIVIFILAFIVFIGWLSARFCFVFLENVIKNTCRIKSPFKTHKKISGSLFRFNLAISGIFIIVSLLIVGGWFFHMHLAGLLNSYQQNFVPITLISIPYILILFFFIFFALILQQLLQDFGTAFMYRKKIPAYAALREAYNLLISHKKEMFVYFLLKMGVAFCGNILLIFVYLLAIIILLIPILILAGLAYLIYMILPAMAKIVFLVMISTSAGVLFLFLIFCLMCLGLPLAVFLRTLSLKFLARLSPEDNLFIL